MTTAMELVIFSVICHIYNLHALKSQSGSRRIVLI